jgi:hypothetical protein
VISKKKNYRFSGRIRTFYRRKTDFYEKKIPSLCRLPRFHVFPNEKLCPPAFQARDFSFWITNESFWSPKTEFVDQKFYKYTLKGTEMQPGVMRAQKREI